MSGYDKLHPLLKRQIKRHLNDWPDDLSEKLSNFLNAIDQAYQQADNDRLLLERAMELSSSELMSAKNAAEQASKIKSQFLANMSHELRTPMNGIIGMSELLSELTLTRDQEVLVDDIRDCSLSLLNIINQVLDLSKIEAEKLVLENEAFNLHKAIEKCVRMFDVRAEEKQIAFVLEQTPGVPEYVIGDELRLGQILINLINNAFKFTPKDGAIMLYIEQVEKVGNYTTLEFHVSDTGIGIHPKNQQFIFDAFAQVDSSHTRLYGGTGLGLAISAQLVSLMGGNISLRSVPHRGSTFSFTARFEIVDSNINIEQQFVEPSQTDVAVRQLKILAVEDNSVNQRLIKKLLERQGHLCDLASNGHQAVELCGSKNYDLVLMDIQMPIMDGVEATNLIRDKFPHLASLPIIAMTANAMVGDREKYLRMGLNDYISKPISRTELKALLLKWSEAK